MTLNRSRSRGSLRGEEVIYVGLSVGVEIEQLVDDASVGFKVVIDLSAWQQIIWTKRGRFVHSRVGKEYEISAIPADGRPPLLYFQFTCA